MTRIIFFFKNHAKNEAGRLVTDLFLSFQKTTVRQKQLVSSFVLTYLVAPNLAYNRNKLYKTLDYWSRDVFIFDFLEKGLGMVFPPHPVYDFLRKIFVMLHSINWPNFIAWLHLLLEILGNTYTEIVC